jgi:hypothetical protein
MEFISNRVTLKGRWWDIIVENNHAPSGDKDDDIKNSFLCRNRETDRLRMYHINILLGNFNAKVGRENIFHGMKAHIQKVMVMLIG